MTWIEAQLDRLVGPTHHFGGLGIGNVASQQHSGQASNPCAAALQGLDKMRRVASLGVPQLIVPPQRRPAMALLRSLGFQGSDSEVLSGAHRQSPELLSAAMSCSAMWTANAATVTPGCDTRSGSTCLTVANLNASIHRAIESDETSAELRRTLPATVQIFSPLPGGAAMRDEGAANHMRLSSTEGLGIHVFVYGDGDPLPERFWPRQTLAAARAIARLHGLDESQAFFLKQHPAAIDAGAFHNDVVAMSEGNLLIHHEKAFLADRDQFKRMEEEFFQRTGQSIERICIGERSLPIEEAVGTYLFNSQILRLQGNASDRAILCPAQVAQSSAASELVKQWREQGLFSEVQYVDLGQSMDGGGGPACLRLRIPLSSSELDEVPLERRWSDRLDEQLRLAIEESYPTRVTIEDLGRADFAEVANLARDRVASLLQPR